MKSMEDITAWNTEKQEQRLFQFLHGLDDRFDLVKRDILKENPLPTVQSAYSSARLEESRLQILGRSNDIEGIGAGLNTRNQQPQKPEQSSTDRSKSKANRNQLKCTNCKKMGHEKQNCFFLNGFPDGWNKRRLPHDKAGQAATPIDASDLSGTTTIEDDFAAYGATRAMATATITGGTNKFRSAATPGENVRHPAAAKNGGGLGFQLRGDVSGAPRVRNKWQETLGDPNPISDNGPSSSADPDGPEPGSDIRTKEIIGRGTERGGLYYVDDIASQGSVLMVSDQKKVGFGIDA
ncbi:hypothetical protein CASFOL_009161 [Castilleja foliolosa]|uniref:CCHC-type domain-containing protein n=1 Tax=Castilleja foliolosa TaxID=1961234 RepID=A0ABD3E1T6_9LAMI